MKRPALSLICLVSGVVAARAELPLAGTVGIGWVENISRTSHKPTAKDAFRAEADLATERHLQLAPDWFGDAGLDLHYSAVPRYDRNNTLEIGPHLTLRRKFGLGPYAPVASASAGVKYRDTGLAGDKGWVATGNLTVAKRLTSGVRLAAMGDWLQEYAAHPTFDLLQRSLRLEFAWDINDRWSFTFNKGRLWGELVANAAWEIYGTALGGGFGPTIQDYYHKIPFEVSGSYGDGWVSYRVHARADVWWMAFTRAVSPRTSLIFRTDGAEVLNRAGVLYKSHSYSLGLAHRF